MITKFHLSVAMMAVSIAGCQAVATQTMTGADGIRQVNQVTWNKTGESFQIPNDEILARDQSRLVFIRKWDESAPETSANIGIDNRFQVSLQEQRYSEVVTCAGNHQVGAQITGEGTNEFTKTAQRFKLMPQKTHYFTVEYTGNNNLLLNEIAAADALILLKDAPRQTHQISRVVSNCEVRQPTELSLSTLPATAVPIAIPQVDMPSEVLAQPTFDSPILLDVKFEFDSATIKPGTYPRLEDLAALMDAHLNITAVLEGHTDSKGAASYNLSLSKARAAAVKTLLVQQYGIAPNRLVTEGYGENKPIASNDSEQGRQQNRRVIAIINQK